MSSPSAESENTLCTTSILGAAMCSKLVAATTATTITPTIVLQTTTAATPAVTPTEKSTSTAAAAATAVGVSGTSANSPVSVPVSAASSSVVNRNANATAAASRTSSSSRHANVGTVASANDDKNGECSVLDVCLMCLVDAFTCWAKVFLCVFFLCRELWIASCAFLLRKQVSVFVW